MAGLDLEPRLLPVQRLCGQPGGPAIWGACPPRLDRNLWSPHGSQSCAPTGTTTHKPVVAKGEPSARVVRTVPVGYGRLYHPRPRHAPSPALRRAPLRTEEWPTSATACARHYATPALIGLPRTAGVNKFPLGWLVRAQEVAWEAERGGPCGRLPHREQKERPAAGREAGPRSTAEAPAPPGTGSERYWSLPPFSVNHAPRTGSYHETGPTALPPAPGDPRGFGVLRGGREARTAATFP